MRREKIAKKIGVKSACKNFALSGIELLKQGKNLLQVASELNISRQRLDYYLKPLKIDGIIKRIGYGVWEVNEEKLKKSSIGNKAKRSKKKSAVANPQKGDLRILPSFKSDNVRGHAFQFTLKLPGIPVLRNWNRRREYLMKNKIEYKKIGTNWKGERIMIDNHKVWLTPISIIVYFPNFRSFMGRTAQDTKNYAIYEFKRIISRVETLLRVSFRINNNYKFKVSRQHYALIKNSLARQCDKEGNKLFCYTEQGLWFIIDNSYNLHEAETIHPGTALTDNEKVQNWFNGLKETPITPGEILQMQYNQTKQQEYYAENIKIHTNSIIKLEQSISIMNGLLKKMDKRISQTQLRKWL